MFTRKQYMNKEITHRKFFAQFVDDNIKQDVLNSIDLKSLLESTDEHLNDIPLKKWDNLAGYVFSRANDIIRKPSCIEPELLKKLKETGEGVS